MAGAFFARHLDVANVRSWTRASMDLPPGGLVLTGPNGAGKTSLVEALVMACLGVSCRTVRDADVIRVGSPALHVALDLVGPDGTESHREIGYAPQQGRRLSVDGDAAPGLATWRLPGSVLVFLPDELRAVKGPPAARRRHLDRLLEACEPGYADSLLAYGTALAQRNAALRHVRSGRTRADAVLPWEPVLARHGARIVLARRGVVAALAGPFAHWMTALGGGPSGVLRLEPSPLALGDVADDDVEQALMDRMEASRDSEIRAAQTLAGPHRDDVFVGEERGGATTDLRRVGSQGEQRTAVLALVMAHRAHLGVRGGVPVLILDDVLSELDPNRRGRLLDAAVGTGQCIMTTADPVAAEAAADRGARVMVVPEALNAT